MQLCPLISIDVSHLSTYCRRLRASIWVHQRERILVSWPLASESSNVEEALSESALERITTHQKDEPSEKTSNQKDKHEHKIPQSLFWQRSNNCAYQPWFLGWHRHRPWCLWNLPPSHSWVQRDGLTAIFFIKGSSMNMKASTNVCFTPSIAR